MERRQRIEYEILDFALGASSPKGCAGSANFFVAWLRRIFPNIAHCEFTDACGWLVTRGALELHRRGREPGAYRNHRGGQDEWFFYRKVHGELHCHEFRMKSTPLSRAVFERLCAHGVPVKEWALRRRA